MNLPQYRIKSVLDEKYDYIHQPQIREYLLGGWFNLIAEKVDDNADTTSHEDIESVYASRGRYHAQPFKTELGAKMVIKFTELERLERIRLREKKQR